MLWLTWRQFRSQAVSAAAALAALGTALGLTGPHLAHLYDTSGIAACHSHSHSHSDCAALTTAFMDQVRADSVYPALYFLCAGVLLLAPALIGSFWGAPLVTRELEAGTFRLAWTQSVTRTRWIAVRLGLVGLAAMAVTGLLSLMITWWAAPIDRAGGFPAGQGQLSRFSPMVFATRDVTPIGYAAFAFALGVTLGALVRRTVPAMALTLVAFAAVQIIMPTVIRPQLVTAAHATTAINADLSSILVTPDGRITAPTQLPGAWIISNQTITPSGQVFVLPVTPACQSGTRQSCDAWLADQHLRQSVTYQPADRYWTFQWYETAIFLVLALATAWICLWLIRRSGG